MDCSPPGPSVHGIFRARVLEWGAVAFISFLVFGHDTVYGLLVPHPEKAKAPHSSTLAWKIPWTEEPGGLQSMGLLRVRHD